MRFLRGLGLFAIALNASGCSIHPIPVDIPGYNTVDIVRKIRCEAAHAIEKNVLALEIEERRRYANAQVVYAFSFAITENNDVGAGAGFRLPFTGSTFTLGIEAGADRERSGTRDFTVTDGFAEALEEIYEVVEVRDARGKRKELGRRKPCVMEAKRENWAYPITGTVGLDESFRTFVGLNSFRLLDPRPGVFDFPAVSSPPVTQSPPPAPPAEFTPFARSLYAYSKKAKKKPGKERASERSDKKENKTEEFSDELEFTTTLKASASPKIELKSAKTGFRLTGADASISGQRIDKHKVTITMTLPKKNETVDETRERAVASSDERVKRSVQESIAKALRRP